MAVKPPRTGGATFNGEYCAVRSVNSVAAGNDKRGADLTITRSDGNQRRLTSIALTTIQDLIDRNQTLMAANTNPLQPRRCPLAANGNGTSWSKLPSGPATLSVRTTFGKAPRPSTGAIPVGHPKPRPPRAANQRSPAGCESQAVNSVLRHLCEAGGRDRPVQIGRIGAPERPARCGTFNPERCLPFRPGALAANRWTPSKAPARPTSKFHSRLPLQDTRDADLTQGRLRHYGNQASLQASLPFMSRPYLTLSTSVAGPCSVALLSRTLLGKASICNSRKAVAATQHG